MAGPFSEYEQRFLLAEVLKAANVSIPNLVQFLREEGVNPDFRFVGLPAGRNLVECETTYESLIQLDELPPHNPNAPYTPGGHGSGSRSSVGRSYVPGGYQASSTRIIKPKPQYPSANGAPSALYSGKKRGRPSKADLERRAQEAAAAAEAGEEGMGLTIGADGAVVAGQKHGREEGDEAQGGNGQDLVSQAQGALAQSAQSMPAALMQVEGQTPAKRPRGRPRKHPRPEEQQQMRMQQFQDQRLEGQQQHENQGQEGQHGQQHNPQHHTPEQQMRSPSEIPGAEQDASATPDEMVLVEQLQQHQQQHQHDPSQAQHAQHQYPHPEGEHEQSTGTLSQSQDVSMSQGSEVEEDGHAMRFFKGLRAQAHGTGGAGHSHP